MSDAIVISQRTAIIDQDTHQVVRVIEAGIERSYVPLKPFCEVLGADWVGARQRIMRDEVLSSVMCEIHITAADGKQYKTLCLPVEYINGFIFGFSASQVRPELREKLIIYKHTCYQKLFEAFTQPAAPATSATLEALAARVQELTEKLNRLEAQPAQPQTTGNRTTITITTTLDSESDLADIITEILHQAQQPVSPSAIRSAHPDLPYHRIKTRMARMARRGILRKLGRGRYILPGDDDLRRN